MDILTREGKVVMCQVTSVKDFGYECQLLENWGYNLEGELLFTEITRKRRLRCKPNRLLSIGKTLPLRITDVMDDLISLTKIQIDREEIEQCEERYDKYRTLDTIMRGISYTMEKDIDELYINIVRPLLQEERTPLDILIDTIEQDFVNIDCDLKVRGKLKEDIKAKVLNKKVKMYVTIKMTCFEPDGVNRIKSALKQGQNDSLTIYLDSAPNYVISIDTKDQETGKVLIQDSIEKIKDSITKNGGQIDVSPLKVIE